MRYGLRAPKLDCTTCTEKQRLKRNCHNHIGYTETIIGKEDWINWPESLKPHGSKMGDLKFYECSRSAITNKTWEILAIVNDTTNMECEVLQLPFEGAWLNQPEWYRTAVRITKRERAVHRTEAIKNPPKKGK